MIVECSVGTGERDERFSEIERWVSYETAVMYQVQECDNKRSRSLHCETRE